MKPRNWPQLLVAFLTLAFGVTLLAQKPVAQSFPYDAQAVFARALIVAHNAFVTVHPDQKHLEISFEQQNQGQNVKGRIRVQSAKGGCKVTVETTPQGSTSPDMGSSGRRRGGSPSEPSITGPDMNSTSTGNRFDRFNQNIQSGESHQVKTNAGINLAKKFLADLQKQLSIEPPRQPSTNSPAANQ